MNLRTERLIVKPAVFALVLLCFSGCKKKAEETPDSVVTVQVTQPSRGAISEEIAADAILAPLSQAAISPRISAPIRAEYVQRGAHVRRGQLLVTLEDRDLQGNALDSKGAVVSAEANYTAMTQATVPEELTKARADAAQLKTALDVAHRTVVERQSLYKQGAISGRDVDTAVAAEAQARAAYETAEIHAQSFAQTTRKTDAQTAQGQLTSARGRLVNAQAQVSYADLHSPIDGVVTDRPMFPGETAAAGSPIITVMDTSYLLAKVHLAQAAAQKLSLGDKAQVHVPGIENPVDAAVSFIGPALDPGSTTVEVWLKLANRDGRLKVGTPVHAVLTGTTVQDAMQIPANAIVPGKDGGTAVMVAAAGGTAHRKPVTVGIRTSEAVQVISGISPSDRVITEGGYGLDDGTKVKVGRPGADDDDEQPGGEAKDKN
jgi:HlyD family secretion protein